MLIPALCREHVTPEMFFTIHALPSPTSARAFAPLFGWFTGTTAQCDFSSTCTSALWFMAFADRPSSTSEGVLEISRFSCMLFSQRARALTTTQDRTSTRVYRGCRVAFLLSEWSRHPVLPSFRSSITPPTGTSVYASPDTSRCPAQDSRPGWSRCFPSCRALASPTACGFIPALSVLPVILSECPCGH